MSENKAEDEDIKRLRKVCNELGDFFDTVQIFVTRHESSEGGTVNAKFGVGNYFARYGQVRQWLMKEDEGTKMEMHPDDSADD